MTLLEDLFNISSPFDLLVNYYDTTQDLTGGIFVYILVTLPFLASWIITKKALVPIVMFTIVGGAMMVIAPWEIKGIAMIMFIFGGAGIVYKWFIDR